MCEMCVGAPLNDSHYGARVAAGEEVAARKSRKPRAKKGSSGAQAKPVVVIGGAVVDMMCQPKVGTKLVLETSNPGTVRQQLGGTSCAGPPLGCALTASAPQGPW